MIGNLSPLARVYLSGLLSSGFVAFAVFSFLCRTWFA